MSLVQRSYLQAQGSDALLVDSPNRQVMTSFGSERIRETDMSSSTGLAW